MWRLAVRMYSPKRALSKLTLVRVEKMAALKNSLMVSSTMPAVALACVAMPASPLSRYSSRSCSAAVSGVLPQTPTVVQPTPLVVCSH